MVKWREKEATRRKTRGVCLLLNPMTKSERLSAQSKEEAAALDVSQYDRLQQNRITAWPSATLKYAPTDK